MDMVKKLIFFVIVTAGFGLLHGTNPQKEEGGNPPDSTAIVYMGEKGSIELNSDQAYKIKCPDSTVITVPAYSFQTDEGYYILEYEFNYIVNRYDFISNVAFNEKDCTYTTFGKIEVYAFNNKWQKLRPQANIQIRPPEVPFSTEIFTTKKEEEKSVIWNLKIKNHDKGKEYYPGEIMFIMDKNVENMAFINKYYEAQARPNHQYSVESKTDVYCFDPWLFNYQLLAIPEYKEMTSPGGLRSRMRTDGKEFNDTDTLVFRDCPVGSEAIFFSCYKTNLGNYYVCTDTFTIWPTIPIYPVYEKRDHQWVMDYLDRLIESVEE